LIAVEGQPRVLVHLEQDVEGVLQLEPGFVFLDHFWIGRTKLTKGEREGKDGCERDHDAVFHRVSKKS
jgi:hypothetical protein